MKTLLTILLTASFAAAGISDHHEETKAAFQEIYKLVGEHLADASDDSINSAAVSGLLERLDPHVQLNPKDDDTGREIPLITQTNRFNRDFGYLRIANVEEGLSAATLAAIRSMLTNGPLRGIVVDLRFANGTDYRAAANFAGLFADKKPVTIKAADEEFHSASGGDAILIPVMVLANSETAAAAEAVAAGLRDIKAGLIIGDKTAGLATIFEDFRLSTGDTLRIATKSVQLGGGREIPSTGVSPDIEVAVSIAEEKKFLDDPYFVERSDQPSTNVFSTRRVTEADLVRQRREGISLEQIISNRQNDQNDRPEHVTDPVLARALDLLKALAVVENWKQD